MTLGNFQTAAGFIAAIGHPDSLGEDFQLFLSVNWEGPSFEPLDKTAFAIHPRLPVERANVFLDSEIFEAHQILVDFLRSR